MSNQHDTRNAELSEVAGCAVELSVCGGNQFVLAAEGDQVASLRTLVEWMPGATVTTIQFDRQNNCTQCFFDKGGEE